MRPVRLVLALSFVAACGGSDGSTGAGGFDDAQVISDFADHVVIPTYAALADRGADLHSAAMALQADPSEPNLAAARDAWAATRVPWEQSEGFLFGPVSANGYDPAIDSWPLNQNDLEAVLAGSDTLTPEFIRGLPDTQKGFHTSEYLVYGITGTKEASALTPRELEYLVALTTDLVDITEALETSWTTAPASGQSYRDVFATAGTSGNTAYPSLSAAAQELLGGMSGICDEVANGKIADPYDAHDPELVESQYSENSIADFQDNLRSVENAYLGRFSGAGGRSLADVVAAVDPALDTRFRAEVTAAIDAIGEIPPPFSVALATEASYPAIEAAQTAVRTVQATIDGALKDAVLDGTAAP